MIKAQKLSGVQALGVSEKYTQDLIKAKATFWQLKILEWPYSLKLEAWAQKLI